MKVIWRTAKLSTLATGFLLLLTLVVVNENQRASLGGVAWADQEQTIELPVTGMTCAACGFAVKTVLKRLDGVSDVKVSYKEKNAVVVYEPQKVTPEQMAQAVNETGTFGVVLPSAGNNQ